MQTSTNFTSSRNNRRKIGKSTTLRVSLNDALQELKKHEKASAELIEDLRFIIFDYLDNYEQIKTESMTKGKYNEFI